jgi:hypothetical protein
MLIKLDGFQGEFDPCNFLNKIINFYWPSMINELLKLTQIKGQIDLLHASLHLYLYCIQIITVKLGLG